MWRGEVEVPLPSARQKYFLKNFKVIGTMFSRFLVKRCNFTSVKSFYLLVIVACLGFSCNIRGIIRRRQHFYIIIPLPERLWTSIIPHLLIRSKFHSGLKSNYKRRKRNFDVNSSSVVLHKAKECGNSYVGKGNGLKLDSRKRRHVTSLQPPWSDIHIEIAVFIDQDLFEHMIRSFPINTETEVVRFVLALINTVELLYQDPSLGRKVNFILKRLEILHADPIGLSRSHDIDKYLNSFCNWQHTENHLDDDNPFHWDHAIILTGYDLYVLTKSGQINSQVVGLAPIAGMCTTTSSCTVNEGRHFDSAYVVAHEIGHNLGMRHDGIGSDNNCDPSSFLMSPTLGSGKVTWSVCSQQYLEKFLESKQSLCLQDRSVATGLLDHRAGGVLPGERFSAHQQCQIKYGDDSRHVSAQSSEEVCQHLQCSKDKYSWTSHPALEGTTCGVNKWCRSGRCVEKGLSAVQAGYRPNQVINGGWSNWSPYLDCASSCLYGESGALLDGSIGIMIAFRRCNNPRPENGGKTCSGNDQKFKTCVASQCSKVKKITVIDFADELCTRASEVDSELTGLSVQRTSSDPKDACAIWCQRKTGSYSSKGWTYPDGTVCRVKNFEQPAFCIKGICKEFVCDNYDEDTLYMHSPEFCPSPLKQISPLITTPEMELIPTVIRDRRKDSPYGSLISSTECFTSCLSPAVGIRIVKKKGCQFCTVVINVQICQPIKQVCDSIITTADYATAVCTKYKQFVRRLSGLGTQLAATPDDLHRPCRLACQDESINQRFYLVNGENGRFPSGTDCSLGNTSRNLYCVNGKCLDFKNGIGTVYKPSSQATMRFRRHAANILLEEVTVEVSR